VVSDEILEEAARRLVEAARAPARVILFGSHARGAAGPDSDLDFLVVEREVTDRFDETVRLRRALKPLRLPVDVIVVSESHVEEWGDVRNTMLHAALCEGRVLAEA
jgi:predicted nucleotidyltransferase